MKTWQVQRSRRVEESCEVEAETAQEAIDIACEEDSFCEYKSYVNDVEAY